MHYHIKIYERIKYREQQPPYTPEEGWYLRMEVNGTKVSVYIPPDIPMTKPAVKAYLLQIAPQIITQVREIDAMSPVFDHEMDTEFDVEI